MRSVLAHLRDGMSASGVSVALWGAWRKRWCRMASFLDALPAWAIAVRHGLFVHPAQW